MSQSHRREVAKKLKEAIDAATDPMVIAELSGKLAKYLPRPKQLRRRRGIHPPIKAKKTSPIVAKWADRLSHVEPEAKRIECSMRCEVEERYKRRGLQIYPPTPESRALLIEVIKEVTDELSAEEQAMLPQVA